MLAVIKTGGKQYVVEQGDVIEVEKLEGKAGDKLVFDEVLLVGDDGDVTVGAPTVAGAKIEAELIDQTRAKKVWGIKHKAKKRYKMKFGHKQRLTQIEIIKIVTKGGAKKATKTEAKTETKEKAPKKEKETAK
jgi:large subunit ribosomal protein L21